MATIRELVTLWHFDIDEKPLHRLEERLHGLKETAFHLGEVILGVLTGEGGGILGLGIATAHAGIEATRMSQTLGMSTQRLQEFQYAAKLSNVEIGSLTSGMRILSLHALQFQRGSAESATAFSLAGIEGPRAGETTDTILMRLATKFHNMADGFEKTGIATQLLGRTGSLLIPFLNKGPEQIKELIKQAHEYGAILSNETIEAGTKFYEITEKAKLAMVGLKNTVGEALIPELTKLTQGMLDWYAANRDVIKQKLEQWIKELMPQLRHLGMELFGIATHVWGLVSALGGLDNVLRIVVSVMAATEGFKFVAFLIEAYTWAVKLRAALMGLAVAEDIVSGGATGVLQLIGAGVGGLGAWWMMSGSNKDFSPGTLQGGGKMVVNKYFNTTLNMPVNTSGDPKVHAKAVADELQIHWTRVGMNFADPRAGR